MKRRAGLTALFWRYLLTTCALLAAIAVLWWGTLTALLASGFVLPAYTAERGAAEVLRAVADGTLDTADIPHYYRWAILTEDGQVTDPGNMDARHLGYARSALAGDSMPHGFPYTQYHRWIPLGGGALCVLQYDYSMPYGSPALQGRLPEFQTCATVVLLAAWAAAAILSTRHFAGLLRRDAALLTAATRAIAHRRLDQPLPGAARFRELGDTLAAMEELRQSLARSLSRQWAMEQQRSRTLAALAHDLKTPLAVIGGNAELLAEDDLTPAQRESAAAILRSAERLRDYVGQLRDLSDLQGAPARPERETVELSQLAAGWGAAGRDLCAPRGLDFILDCPVSQPCSLYRADVDRAVLNLLDNAARFTPAGGSVRLEADVAGHVLTVAVTDTGPGFSPEALARAGKELFTGDASRPQDGHMGLGLCFARQVAVRHGGELALSNTGTGARAALTLPLAEP